MSEIQLWFAPKIRKEGETELISVNNALVFHTDHLKIVQQLKQEKSDLEQQTRVLKVRIDTAVNACDRCRRGDKLFIEPLTGFYTHALGGNHCNAHTLHNFLGTETAARAREANNAG